MLIHEIVDVVFVKTTLVELVDISGCTENVNDGFKVALLVTTINVLRAKDDFVERLDAIDVVKLVDVRAVVEAVVASDGSNVAATMNCLKQ